MITILANAENVPMADPHDIRSFISGETEELSPANEKLLIERGVAEPSAGSDNLRRNLADAAAKMPSLETRLAMLEPEQREHLAVLAHNLTGSAR